MLNYYIVRELEQEDCNSVLRVALKAWLVTYKGIYDEEFIRNFIQRAYRQETLEKIIEQTKEGLTKFLVLVETTNKSICGFAHVGFDKFWVTNKKIEPLRLFRIYLLPELTGKGLGKILLAEVEEYVRKEGTSYIVGVHEKNNRGMHFYKKNGFKQITKESDTEGEIFFEKFT